MHTVHWVLQDKITSDKDLLKLQKAFKKYNCSYEIVPVIPFDAELPNITPTCQHVVVYGSTVFVERVYQRQCWQPGVYFSMTKFRPSYWSILLGDDVLNADGYEITLRDVPERLDDGELYFARPNDDLKLFPGMVVDKRELMTVVNNTDQLDSSVWLASPKTVKSEWRFFIVDHQIVTGSQYRSRGYLNIQKAVPAGAWAFADHAVIKLCNVGSGTYILDICEYNKEYKVVELGCLNAAGFYACDIDKIVKAVVDMETGASGQVG